MTFLDYANIGIALFSAYGAYKSNVYYKKSKQLITYANTNIAFIESKKILDTLTQMLKLANKTQKRGINYSKQVAKNGEIINSSIVVIRENLPVKDFREIDNLLRSKDIDVLTYINSFISGEVLVNESFIINDDFKKCQKIFLEVQLLIKDKIENLTETLK